VETGAIDEEELKQVLKAAQETPDKKIGEVLISEGVATPRQVLRPCGNNQSKVPRCPRFE